MPMGAGSIPVWRSITKWEKHSSSARDLLQTEVSTRPPRSLLLLRTRSHPQQGLHLCPEGAEPRAEHPHVQAQSWELCVEPWLCLRVQQSPF